MTARAIRRPAASSSRGEAAAATAAEALCRHCGAALPRASPSPFCCRGCEAAFGIIQGLGLESFYRRRAIDPAQRLLKPEDEAPQDLSRFVTAEPDGTHALHLMVDGLQCAACVWLIESALARLPEVAEARVNLTSRRLLLRWRGKPALGAELVGLVRALGYRLAPYDAARLAAQASGRERELLRAMAAAGFAAGNVMLLSISVWAGNVQDMGAATRELMHWFSALIALPAVVYAGWPFYRSALRALRAGRANMDVPISLAVILAGGMSLYETVTGGPYAYFDAAVTLLFFLLVGRYLDNRARGQARGAAERLLALAAGSVTVEDPSGARCYLPPSEVRPGMIVLCAPGERIGVDGRVREGISEIDTSLITGETVPAAARPGARVFAGTLNMSGLLRIEALGAGRDTLLSEIVRLMEAAEQGRARYVAIADRVAQAYVPVVHSLAAGTFLAWFLWLGAPWQSALLNAVAVLIVTCPCALALAVPVVQVVASGRLLRQGILVKSATALERLAGVSAVVFDKTGTLTEGRPELVADPEADPDALRAAAALAAASKHPLARALVRAAPGVTAARDVEERPGFGLRRTGLAGEVRLGSRRWCNIPEEAAPGDDAGGPELWLAREGHPPVRFRFADRARADAAQVIGTLARQGLSLELLSGDRPQAVASVAAALGIPRWQAAASPADKIARLEALAAEGSRVLMVGDGLNDAPALAAAHVSMSPASAVDISQTAADLVFQGPRLAPVLEALEVARRADRLVRQNFALALFYNLASVPLAMTGFLTPLIAALAMSSSSLLVTANALRLNRRRRRWT